VVNYSFSEDKFEVSTVTSGDDTRIDQDIRRSEVALLDRDEAVKCIEDRARSFQGWRRNLVIERLRSQRYATLGHYVHHYDWSGMSKTADRVSTFMVYVHANCTGGGTEFPRLKMPEDPRWCEFLDCGEESKGVTFKPISGNAVFWENLRSDGSGYTETWHAGLPVTSGVKVGLNIWSWYTGE
jgi:prolyl 4-hydroxylase